MFMEMGRCLAEIFACVFEFLLVVGGGIVQFHFYFSDFVWRADFRLKMHLSAGNRSLAVAFASFRYCYFWGAFPQALRWLAVADGSPGSARITAAGTVADLHGVPF